MAQLEPHLSKSRSVIICGVDSNFRFGESDEIAGVAAFLASEDASYITGETIAAGGGMQSRL